MNLFARAFLFDFDGTLVDSAPLHEWAFRAALATADPAALEHFDYEAIKGLPTRRSFSQLGITDNGSLDWCVAAKQRLYREAIACGRLKAFSGAREVLEIVRAGGASIFLVTSGSCDSVRPGLAFCELDGFFAGVITAEDAPAGKPSPAPYRACLARYGLSPASAIAVEDALAGVRAAHAAGLPVIGVHNPAVAASADLYFPDFATMSAVMSGAGQTAHVGSK